MRALLKTMSYSVMHVTVATLLAYLISGSWAIAVSIGLLEPAVQTFFYYFHERAWEGTLIKRRIPVQVPIQE